ncbi:ComEC/Rec2 family competence protein [Falsarthrobacter nasiphocae]|uniref:Competence protein ComEC n=1 Tax=Falsarthrobacter nasiphocae TaxID=189863 RepID=A0AAE3YE50_9MICC|nr:ComEC/Rec2 family competence protein [Falsarthrobacter nasiphocae]MDR6891062.1 competence protein ComEC [Falsarthrobacter nasiphocae]
MHHGRASLALLCAAGAFLAALRHPAGLAYRAAATAAVGVVVLAVVGDVSGQPRAREALLAHGRDGREVTLRLRSEPHAAFGRRLPDRAEDRTSPAREGQTPAARSGGARAAVGLCEAEARIVEPTWADGTVALVRTPCAGGADAPGAGDVVRGRVGSVSPPRGQPQRHAVTLTLKHVETVEGSSFAAIRQARRAAEAAFAVSAGAGSGRVAAAMVYGGEAGDPGAHAAMRAAGLSHLTAVSGANCAVLVAAAVMAARLCRVGLAVQTGSALASVVAFVALCGPDATVLRAAAMGSVGAIGALVGRGRSPFALLGVAILVLLAADPWIALEIGFGLSAAATAGILLWSSWMTERLATVLPAWLASPLAMTLSAMLACQPILALITDNVPGLSPAANVVVAPLVPIVTLLGTGVVLLAPLHAGAAAAMAWVPNRSADAIVWVARTASSSHLNETDLPVGAAGSVLAFALAAAVTWRAGAPPRQRETWLARHPALARGRAAVWAVPAALVAAFLAPPERGVLREWQAAACDVGQGDAVLLRTGADRAVLVDAGPPGGGLPGCLRELGVRALDLVVITHGHADHFGGLADLAGDFGAPAVVVGEPEGSERFQARARVAPDRLTRADRSRFAPGDVLFDQGGLRLTLIRASPPAASGANENAESLVLLARSSRDGSDLTLLLTGDLETGQDHGVAETLRGELHGERLDLVKTAHHGAKNGTRAYLDAALPRLALISVGRANPYGHPHAATLRELGQRGIAVRRTDESGTVTVRKRGADLEVRSQR